MREFEETDALYYGVVESVFDPLNLGRGKVRWYIPSQQFSNSPRPTNTLPWVQLTSGTSFDVPPVGSIVQGWFEDGKDFQKPVFMKVIPRWDKNVPQPVIDYKRTDVVSPQAQDSANKSTKSSEKEKAPVRPSYVGDGKTTGPSWSLSAQGIVANTGIAVANANLSHVCDFRYQFSFDISGLGLTNPITAITTAIKNGKNNAANFIAMLIKKLNDTIATAIKTILKAIGLDPTGTSSLIYAKVTATLQDINDFIRDVAEYVEVAATIYYIVKNIHEIVDYLNSLPARFLAIVKDCITRFLNGAKQFVAQVAAVPGQIGATIDTLGKSIQAGADEILGKQQEELDSIKIPSSLDGIFTHPNIDHSNTIIQYVSDTYGNANTIMAKVEENNYDPTKVQWA